MTKTEASMTTTATQLAEALLHRARAARTGRAGCHQPGLPVPVGRWRAHRRGPIGVCARQGEPCHAHQEHRPHPQAHARRHRFTGLGFAPIGVCQKLAKVCSSQHGMGNEMSPHGQHLLEEARAYMARLIAKGATPTDAAQKAGDWFGFHPSTVTGAAS